MGNRTSTIAALVSLLLSLAARPGLPAPLEVPERGFVSSRPAETWEQGLITGNGTIGASVLSRPLDETIVFSHERLFLPEAPPMMPPLTAPRLFEIRKLIERGLYLQASELAFDMSDQEGFRYPDRFVPAFDLGIRMDADVHVSDYARSVNFETGEATVRWTGSLGAFERRLFVSRADGVAVLRITGPGPRSVSCRIELRQRDPDHQRVRQNVGDLELTADESSLVYQSRFTNAYPGSIHALEGVAVVKTRGGSTSVEGGTQRRRRGPPPKLVVSGADEVLVLVDISPLYDPEKSQIEATRAALSALPADYATLLARHARIHGEIFGRMRLDLGGGRDHRLTTEELIANSTDADPSRALIEKQFDAGRYNILSSTGELPPTLQGVWAGTWDPPWASDFTHNGNVPSAIASLLMGNMPELMLAYTSYMESIVPYMELNARRIFGARGIVLPSRSTTNGFNNAFAPRFAGAFWVAGAAWASHFVYDYYLYTGDREYLAEHALPFMEKAAVFFEDYLFEGSEGKYVFSPTQSPENTPGNSNSQASYNATMAVAAAKELLRNLISGSTELGVNGERIPVWQAMLEKMPDYMIGEEGAVKEWLTPALEDNFDHRHSSQLYALFDGMPEEIAADPELQAAFSRLIELKLDRHWSDWESQGGFMSFGLVQTGLAAASLGNAELAYRSLVPLINHYWFPSLASTHNYKSLFNMDISGGMPAVIIRMLVASDPGSIWLFPARPDAWTSGTIEGVLCRGQVEIERLRWRAGAVSLTLVSAVEQELTLRAPGAIRSLTVERGAAAVREVGREDVRSLSLPAGEEVELELTLR